MIYLKICGRAGNQLFQYATVKSIKTKYYPDEPILVDFSNLKKLGTKEDGFDNSLSLFNVDDIVEVKNIKTNIIQKFFIFIMKIPLPLFNLIGLKKYSRIIQYKFDKFMQPMLNKIGIYYMANGYYEFKKSKAKNKIFIGNFESSKYFDNIRDDILEMYKPKNTKSPNENLLHQISKLNSVCISIRRGDFLDNGFSSIHYVCNEEYFYKAISIIKSKIDDPTFVVFSDDIEWVKKNMDFGAKTLYETGKDDVAEKLRLMSSCKHFILSNSTFSWWAQYLSKNENRVVISPKKWKNISYKKNVEEIDIYQDFWIRI